MRMFHHDDREYETAVGEATGKWQAEMDALLERGRSTALAVIEKVQREIPEDAIVPAGRAIVVPREERLLLSTGESERPLHAHAIGQLATRAEVPDRFVSLLLERGELGRELLAHNINKLLGAQQSRLLVRSVNGEVRGVLSDKFRRLDSRPVIEAFASACGDMGAVPVDGVGGELRFELKALLPKLFRPAGDEVIAFGLSLSNSDFGCGALSLRVFCLRLWCTNYAKLEEELRKVHLGGRLGDDLAFSARTYRLDTETMASAVRDLVQGILSPAKVNAQVAAIARTMEQPIDVGAALKGLPKMGLLKGEVERVAEVFRTGGIEQLPRGDTTFRLSNAVSWIAKKAPTAERRLELEDVAGSLLKVA